MRYDINSNECVASHGTSLTGEQNGLYGQNDIEFMLMSFAILPVSSQHVLRHSRSFISALSKTDQFHRFIIFSQKFVIQRGTTSSICLSSRACNDFLPFFFGFFWIFFYKLSSVRHRYRSKPPTGFYQFLEYISYFLCNYFFHLIFSFCYTVDSSLIIYLIILTIRLILLFIPNGLY